MATIIDQVVKSHLSTGGVSQNNVTALQTSKQHNEYSLNGTPGIVGKPTPSRLDPKQPPSKYSDNLPL